MSMNNLHGIENVQARQLADITNILYNEENPPSLSDMQTNLLEINNSMGVLNDGMKNVLSDQSNVQNLVQGEKRRLENKQEHIDEARESQTRTLNLNDSYRKKYAAYLKIVMVLTISLVAVWLLRILPDYLSFIPSLVFEVAITVVVFFGLVIMYFQYKEIQTHNPLNYDELNYSGPEFKLIGLPETTPTPTPGSGFGPFGCVGPQCCGPNTQWDEENAVCRDVLETDESSSNTNDASQDVHTESDGMSPQDVPTEPEPEYSTIPLPDDPSEGFKTRSNYMYEYDDYARYR